jgi:hypothetical protein
VLRVLADNHYFAFSLNDLALFANLFYGWFNLHFIIPTLSLLLGTPGYAALSKIVNRYLYGNLVARQYSDIVHSELSRDRSRYYVSVGKLYLEDCVGQCLNYRAFKFNNIILRQNNPSSALYLCFNLPALIDERRYYNAVRRKRHRIFVMSRKR